MKPDRPYRQRENRPGAEPRRSFQRAARPSWPQEPAWRERELEAPSAAGPAFAEVPRVRHWQKRDFINYAAKIIRQTSRERPADGVLREVLKGDTTLRIDQRRRIAQMVFTYYRWRGFFPGKIPVEARLDRAMHLARRFADNPFTMDAGLLRAKAVPEWVPAQVDCRVEWLRSLQREPRPWLRARPGSARKLANKLGDCRVPGDHAVPDAVEYLGVKDLFHLPEFEAGEFEVQDIASQAVSQLCVPQPGETWLDACAGEGGKTLHLADLMQNKGLIWATDRAEWRLDILSKRAARAKQFNHRVAVWDGGAKLPTKTLFDGVLLDAPCTGAGTWHRSPHARWLVRLQDVEELAALQKSLLRHVAPAVKPGGKLFYAVCTLTSGETVDVVNAFEAEAKDFEPLPLANPFEPLAPPAHPLWLWPQKTGGNGMFIAAWRRKSASVEPTQEESDQLPRRIGRLPRANPLTPSLSPSDGERVPEGRVRRPGSTHRDKNLVSHSSEIQPASEAQPPVSDAV
jgi:16S rRNA (cytosine967-C5)-methyltransferase